ncbi:MAG: 4-alpha-glucanotransferase [Lentisphaerae bacterium]|nr:4-alpha-glucanotransferase [Lentisphaerota bacterium]
MTTMGSSRRSGILLHPTSLAGPEGVGTLGSEAYDFVDFLHRAGQKLWQVLPLGPPGYGESPYACFSSVAGNSLLISLERLERDGWLEAGAAPSWQRGKRVHYRHVMALKPRLLALAHARFAATANAAARAGFDAFCAAQHTWLPDYALFMAIKEEQGGRPWWRWPAPLRYRRPAALRQAGARVAGAIEREKFLQYVFFMQWGDLRQHAHARGVQVVGDMPIYVAHDSADVWAYPDVFLLDRRRLPRRVAGVPPDYFSRTGQLWGNPVYNWAYLRRTAFAWWVQRLRANLALYDVVRFDHFRGLAAYWGVPYGHRTAVKGRWYLAPGAALLRCLQKELGTLPMIVEDLGMITPDVRRMREAFNLPGMKILHYAFGGGADSEFLPHNYPRHCVVYTGTHDNDTTRSWYRQAPAPVKRHVRLYVGEDAARSAWPFIRLAWQSVADTALVPMQDLLDLDGRSRMNVPGTSAGNWEWRMRGGEFTPALARRLRQLTEAYGR